MFTVLRYTSIKANIQIKSNEISYSYIGLISETEWNTHGFQNFDIVRFSRLCMFTVLRLHIY